MRKKCGPTSYHSTGGASPSAAGGRPSIVIGIDAVAAAEHRTARSEADALDARHGRRRVARARHHVHQPRGRLVDVARRQHPREHDAAAVEAGLPVEQLPEAARQQARAHEQHQRERELRDDEPRPQPGVARVRLAKALERAAQIRPRGPPRRREPEEHGRGRREQEREERHAPVDAHLVEPRDGGRRQRHERARRPDGEREAERPAGERDHEALGQQLPHEAPAPGAERGAHGELGRPARRAHEQEARHVRARDEQHEADRAQEHPERPADVADDLPAQAQGLHAPPRVVLGIRLLELCAQRLQLRVQLRHRHAVGQPAEGREAAPAAIVDVVDARRERLPHLPLADPRDERVGRQDADDREGLAVERDRPADDGRVAPEAPPARRRC